MTAATAAAALLALLLSLGGGSGGGGSSNNQAQRPSEVTTNTLAEQLVNPPVVPRKIPMSGGGFGIVIAGVVSAFLVGKRKRNANTN